MINDFFDSSLNDWQCDMQDFEKEIQRKELINELIQNLTIASKQHKCFMVVKWSNKLINLFFVLVSDANTSSRSHISKFF